MGGSPHWDLEKGRVGLSQQHPVQGQWLLDSTMLADGAVRCTQVARLGGQEPRSAVDRGRGFG